MKQPHELTPSQQVELVANVAAGHASHAGYLPAWRKEQAALEAREKAERDAAADRRLIEHAKQSRRVEKILAAEASANTQKP